jgi:hypothetical protein
MLFSGWNIKREIREIARPMSVRSKNEGQLESWPCRLGETFSLVLGCQCFRMYSD